MGKKRDWLSAVLVVGALAGCSGSSNDQGTSVASVGFFRDTQSCGTFTTPVQSVEIPLGVVFGEGFQQGPGSSFSTDTPDVPPIGVATGLSSSVFVPLGLVNSIAGQTFQVDRLLLSYFIPGASEQAPMTNVPVSLLLGPGPTTATGGGATGAVTIPRPPSSLPPGLQGLCNSGLAVTTVLPDSILSWMFFNQAKLPPLPFQAEVTVVATGVTSSGNRIEANPVTLTVRFVNETPVVVDDPDSGDAALIDGSSETVSEGAVVEDDSSSLEGLESVLPDPTPATSEGL
jgi:hypothetical protein